MGESKLPNKYKTVDTSILSVGLPVLLRDPNNLIYWGGAFP